MIQRIFLSHSSKDEQRANEIASILRGDKLRVDHMSEWTSGRSFVAEMNSALERCDVMLALWSPHYFASEMCMAELEAAFHIDKEEKAGFLRIAKIAVCETPRLYRTLRCCDFIAGVNVDVLRQQVYGHASPKVDAPPFKFVALAKSAAREPSHESLVPAVRDLPREVTWPMRPEKRVVKAIAALRRADPDNTLISEHTDLEAEVEILKGKRKYLEKLGRENGIRLLVRDEESGRFVLSTNRVEKVFKKSKLDFSQVDSSFAEEYRARKKELDRMIEDKERCLRTVCAKLLKARAALGSGY